MSQLATAALTMSSSDIAELVESRHDHVKRSIERLAERGVIELPPMGEVKNHLNQSVSVYLIGKRDSYIVVAQLSPEFTARLVDRWQELEQAQQQTIPQSFSEALRLAADLAEQKQQLTSEYELIIAHFVIGISLRAIAKRRRCSDGTIRKELQMAMGVVEGILMVIKPS
ncbi:hypothetical protein DIL44_16295 [Salmonella enterica]|nr:hypothetical protein [Salmonella enterica]